MPEQAPVKKLPNRLVIITGDKGGVGKSTFARGLVQTYINAGRKFLAFDADISNSQLKRFYGKDCHVEPIDIFENGRIDIFFDDFQQLIYPQVTESGEMPEKQTLFLLELPPQSRRILEDFVEKMNFLVEAENIYEMRVTMVVVINKGIDSLNQLLSLFDFYKGAADYIVVQNLFFGKATEFLVQQDYKAAKKNLSSKTQLFEITMPQLIEHAYNYLDMNNLTFKQGMEQTVKPSVKGRVTSWLKTFSSEIQPVKHLLGLEDVENVSLL